MRVCSGSQNFGLPGPLSLGLRCAVDPPETLTSWQWFSLSILTAIFPGGPGLAGTRMSLFWILLQLRVMEVAVTTGPITRAKLQSNCHHQQTNTQLSTGRMPFLLPDQQCQSTEGKWFTVRNYVALHQMVRTSIKKRTTTGHSFNCHFPGKPR